MIITDVVKSKLNNGLTLITENIPDSTSAVIGVFVKAGSIHERYGLSGIAHFVEHLVFKGSLNRSSFSIVDAIESKGGYINAYTEKDLTTFFARVLPRDVIYALDILCDMIFYPEFSSANIQQEKSVIIEEINDFIDTPQDYANETFIQKMYPGHAFGTYILGEKKSIKTINRDHILDFHRCYYQPSNMVVVISGSVSHDEISNFLNKIPSGNGFCPHDNDVIKPITISKGEVWIEKDDIGQAHLVYGCHFDDTDRIQKYSLALIQLILSGGMSSRLFQNIREKYGFVYSIESSIDTFAQCGVFTIYAGVEKKKIEFVKKLIQKEIVSITPDNITNMELQRIKMQFEGHLIINMENPENRMERIGRHIIQYDTYLSPAETMDIISGITCDDLSRSMTMLNNLSLYNTFSLIPR
ncbi:MAG TPA: insulinase family protein [Candidatus Marinimicrobia bacterium]|nr:insulinase family protein [Candidatus Neomarinimicrobiota bacterium]